MSEPVNTKQLVAALLDGLEVKARTDGTVLTVKAADGKATVAEVCVGARKVRLNFRATPKGAIAKQVGGRSKMWGGGGVVVDDKNVKAARAALVAAAQVKPAARKAVAAAAA